MASLSRAPALLSGLALACFAGCASPVSTQALAAPPPGQRVDRIAIAPPIVAPQIERTGATARDVEPEATEMVGSRLVEALALQGEIEYVAPGEVALWLEQRGLSAQESDPQRLAAEVARGFDADAVLLGRVRRYLSRIGGEHGATRPASVWFDLELRLPDGTVLWAGSYREAQKSLADDVLSLPRAAQRGFTWLDAPGLAEYGARVLIARLARERREWR